MNRMIAAGIERLKAEMAPGLERMRNIDHPKEIRRFAYGMSLCMIMWIAIYLLVIVFDLGTVRASEGPTEKTMITYPSLEMFDPEREAVLQFHTSAPLENFNSLKSRADVIIRAKI